MKKVYLVRLSDEERDTCLAVIKKLGAGIDNFRDYPNFL